MHDPVGFRYPANIRRRQTEGDFVRQLLGRRSHRVEAAQRRLENLRSFHLVEAVDREESPGQPAFLHSWKVDVAVARIVTLGELPSASLQMAGRIDVRVDDNGFALHPHRSRLDRLAAFLRLGACVRGYDRHQRQHGGRKK